MSTTPQDVQNNVIDLDLSVLRKQRIRIDGDDNRIVELNLSDMDVMRRLQEAYERLTQLSTKYHIQEESEDDNTDEMIKALQIIDTEMRQIVDYIFDSDVSDVAAPFGTMADPINGRFRYDHIIEKFLDLYDTNFTKEFKQMSKNVQKHTDKYTKRK